MTSPISIHFKIEKATPTGRFVSGWLSVVEKDGKIVTDTQEDRISLTELAKGVHKYMRGSRVIKKQHTGGQIGEMIEVLIIDDDVAKALGMTTTKRGAWGKAEITDEATREDVRKGKVTGWSMGGRGKRVPVVKAKMRFADGSKRKLSRRQIREVKTQNAVDGRLRRYPHGNLKIAANPPLWARHVNGPANSQTPRKKLPYYTAYRRAFVERRVEGKRFARMFGVRKSFSFFDRYLTH